MLKLRIQFISSLPYPLPIPHTVSGHGGQMQGGETVIALGGVLPFGELAQEMY